MTSHPPRTGPGPRSLGDLFLSLNTLALQGFGGVIAIAQRELVERKRWLTQEQFLEDWAVAQILPGPNIVNLALMLGSRHFGLRGALVALAGLFLVPMCILMSLVLLYSGVAGHPAAQGALRGMGAVVGGLILATAIKLLGALGTNPMGRPACGLIALTTFVAVVVFRVPLPWTLATVGLAACLWAYHRLGRSSPDEEAGR